MPLSDIATTGRNSKNPILTRGPSSFRTSDEVGVSNDALTMEERTYGDERDMSRPARVAEVTLRFGAHGALPQLRCVTTCADGEGNVYCYGGDDVMNTTKALIHVSTKLPWSWRTVHSNEAAWPPKVIMACMAYHRGVLLLYGGKGHAELLSDELWAFDLALAEWRLLQTTGAAPPGLWCATANVLTGDRLLIYGGTDPSGRVSGNAYVFDMHTLHWTCVVMPFARESHRAVLLNDVLYVFGGMACVVDETVADVQLPSNALLAMDTLAHPLVMREVHCAGNVVPLGVQGHCMVACAGELWVVGNCDGGG